MVVVKYGRVDIIVILFHVIVNFVKAFYTELKLIIVLKVTSRRFFYIPKICILLGAHNKNSAFL